MQKEKRCNNLFSINEISVTALTTEPNAPPGLGGHQHMGNNKFKVNPRGDFDIININDD